MADLLHKEIANLLNNPPEYIPREIPSYETCSYIFTRGMYYGERCYKKPEVSGPNGKSYCKGCTCKIKLLGY